jgi:hypothetical protein
VVKEDFQNCRSNPTTSTTTQTMKKIKWIEFFTIISCIIFAIAISLFHLSSNGEDGLTPAKWGVIWTISENGLAISLCLMISFLVEGLIKIIFRWVFIPYFAIKLLYHISCYSGIYFLPIIVWSWIWTIELIVWLIITFILCIIYLIYEKK